MGFAERAETLASTRSPQRGALALITMYVFMRLLLLASLCQVWADLPPPEAPRAVVIPEADGDKACWIPSEIYPAIKCERVPNTCPDTLTLAEAELCKVCERGAHLPSLELENAHFTRTAARSNPLKSRLPSQAPSTRLYSEASAWCLDKETTARPARACMQAGRFTRRRTSARAAAWWIRASRA